MRFSIKQDNIIKRVKEILSEKLDFPVEMINSDSLLVDNLGMDSVGALEVIFSIEEEFEIKISRKNHVNIKTFQDIIRYIIEQIETQSRRAKS